MPGAVREKRRNSFCPLTVALLVVLCATSPSATAGPWSQLPEAVTRLQRRAADAQAQVVVRAAEDSVTFEAADGSLGSVAALMDAYIDLVSPLRDGERRIAALELRVATALLARGDQLAETDPAAAGTAWALASGFGKLERAGGRLAKLLLPPSQPQPGQLWSSPVDGGELVWMPEFRFRPGCTFNDRLCKADESAGEWVTLPGLWVDLTEVTNRRYRLCMDEGACTAPEVVATTEAPERADYPVSRVTWEQALMYSLWAGRRLPTEVEWERAARGTRTEWRFPWGNSLTKIRANIKGTSSEDRFHALAPVGAFPATGWGVFDAAGNASEWCQDAADTISASGEPPVMRRAVRGGSWRRGIDAARVSARTWMVADEGSDDVGFRCVLDATSELQYAEVAALARQVFPLQDAPARAFEAAQLGSADRRYLGRRAVRWLMLEGRMWSALPQAVSLLSRQSTDPVALDVLSRIEDGLQRAAAQGAVDDLERDLERYRREMAGLAELEPRLRALDLRLAQALGCAGDGLRRRGDVVSASISFRFALRLEPNDPDIRRMARAAIPPPGTVRLWRGDDREMVWIPAGSFLIGATPSDPDASADEKPQRMVRVDGYWLDRTEVTNTQYRRCVEAGGCTPPHRRDRYDNPAYGDHPVLWIDWFQARAYSRWSGKRLPSEAEWERAARAGSADRYPWGGTWRDGRANAGGARGDDRWTGTSPVASFDANEWGLVDTLGNALEWVEDVYHRDLENGPKDGSAWTQAAGGGVTTERVLRGGSYRDLPVRLRLSERFNRPPHLWSRATGFRCAADG